MQRGLLRRTQPDFRRSRVALLVLSWTGLCLSHVEHGVHGSTRISPIILRRLLCSKRLAVGRKSPMVFGSKSIHSDAGIRESSAVVIRDVYGIAKKRLIHRPAQIIDAWEMQLMNVEGMKFGKRFSMIPVLTVPVAIMFGTPVGIEHLGRHHIDMNSVALVGSFNTGFRRNTISSPRWSVLPSQSSCGGGRGKVPQS